MGVYCFSNSTNIFKGLSTRDFSITMRAGYCLPLSYHSYHPFLQEDPMLLVVSVSDRFLLLSYHCLSHLSTRGSDCYWLSLSLTGFYFYPITVYHPFLQEDLMLLVASVSDRFYFYPITVYHPFLQEDPMLLIVSVSDRFYLLSYHCLSHLSTRGSDATGCLCL